MSRYLLYGYYGERNAGDDAFTIVCSAFLRRSGARHIGVLAPELPCVPAFFGKTMRFRRRWRGIADRLEDARIRRWGALGASVIVGGGSVLRDRDGLSELSALIKRAPHGRHAALGVSIGPYKDDVAPKLLADLLPRFSFVGVRDAASLSRAKEVAPEAPVKLTIDLGPLLPGVRTSPVEIRPPRREGLGIALCTGKVSDRDLGEAAEALSRALDQGLADRLVLLSFNSHPRKGDGELHRALAGRIDRPDRVELVEYDGNPFAMWDRIGRLRAIVAMRLHAAVFAHGTLVPTFVVPYEEKGFEWGAMIGHPTSMIGTLSEAVGRGLPLILGDSPPMPTVTPAETEERARSNFEWLGLRDHLPKF